MIQTTLFSFILLILTPSVSRGVAGWSQVGVDSTVVKLGEGCTGTRISNDGYILTARHCFNGCLISEGFVSEERLFPEYGWQSPKLYRLNQEAFCPTSVDGVEKNVEVVATGPGFMTPIEQGSLLFWDSALYTELLEKSYMHNGDFAIIKEQRASATSCRGVNWESVSVNDQVSFRGYPGESGGRPEGRNSDGVSILEGSGVIVNSILDNSCVGENANNTQALTLRYDRDDILLSTVDNIPGGSGSALLNEDGEIIGLINSQYRQGIDVQSTYCSGSTVAVPTAHIKKLLVEGGFKNSEIQSFFNCF